MKRYLVIALIYSTIIGIVIIEGKFLWEIVYKIYVYDISSFKNGILIFPTSWILMLSIIPIFMIAKKFYKKLNPKKDNIQGLSNSIRLLYKDGNDND